jgi:hypothetical protein
LAKQVRLQAKKWLSEKGEQGVQSVSDVVEGVEEARNDQPSTPVVEMGGESRRRKAPLELAVA